MFIECKYLRLKIVVEKVELGYGDKLKGDFGWKCVGIGRFCSCIFRKWFLGRWLRSS